MEGSLSPVQADGASNILDGNLVLAHLLGDDSQQMPRIGKIRLDLQNLPIDLLGNLESPRLMVLDGDR